MAQEAGVGFLLNAITHAEKNWGQNPGFRNILFKLQQVREELDTLSTEAEETPQPRQQAATRALGG
jgi:hypothetical protein